jgi:hypothetical protein
MDRIFVPAVAGAVLVGTASARRRRGRPLSGRVIRMLTIAGAFAGVSVITSASLITAQESGLGNQAARTQQSEQVCSPDSNDR